jgi:YD repeat-containing protein
MTRGNGFSTGYGYDALGRLTSLSHDPAGTTHDLTLGFAYNPAGQIVENTRTNDLYSWTGHGNGATTTTANGLNQIAGWNGAIVYDGATRWRRRRASISSPR